MLLLDIIEQAGSPERFLEQIKTALTFNSSAKLIVCAANVGFFVTRAMHLFGQFNYSRKGILSLEHTRLFTFTSLQRLLEESGFEIETIDGIPAPYPLVVGSKVISGALITVNASLIKVSPGLFAYQILMTAKPKPSLPALLQDAYQHSEELASGKVKPSRNESSVESNGGSKVGAPS